MADGFGYVNVTRRTKQKAKRAVAVQEPIDAPVSESGWTIVQKKAKKAKKVIDYEKEDEEKKEANCIVFGNNYVDSD